MCWKGELVKTKQKVALIIGIGGFSLAAALTVIFCLLYFLYQIPLYDRGGWHETKSGTMQYWDYYGKPMTLWLNIDGKTYYFDSESGDMCIGWLDTENGRYYLNEEGIRQTGWLDTEEGRYFLNEEGILQTGWLDTETGRYYLGQEGVMQTGWLTYEEQRYYLAPDGTMTVGWLELMGSRYFFNEAGTLCTGWLDAEEGRYYLSTEGAMQTGWIDTHDGRFYLNEQGLLQTNWVQTEDGWYYLNADGSPYTGWMTVSGGKSFFDKTGLMQIGWVYIDGSRYYFNSDGIMQKGWLTLSGKQYYLDSEGKSCTGWQLIDGVKYYFNNSGVRVTGWVTTSDGRYYLHEDGSLATGFVEIGGIERYFTDAGEYIPLVNPWNTVPEDYTPNLVSLEGYLVDASCRDMLSDMMKACRAAGHTCVLNSTYRDISTQQYLWNNRYNNHISQGCSAEEAKRLTWQIVAYPGTSEHHLGLAIDIVGTDAMYTWLQEHSWEYGFIVRYPSDKTDVTGIIYEPWHIRYVGKALAEEMNQSGLCLEEHLETLKAD